MAMSPGYQTKKLPESTIGLSMSATSGSVSFSGTELTNFLKVTRKVWYTRNPKLV